MHDGDPLITVLKSHEKEIIDYLNSIYKITASKFLNTPSMRFTKGCIVDFCLSQIVTEFEYVDEQYYDVIFNEYKISIKSEQKMFQKRLNKTKEIVISNLNGENTESKIDLIDFDYLLIVSTAQKGVAIARRSDIHMQLKNSQIVTEIPFENLHFVVYPDFKLRPPTISDEKERRLRESYLEWVLDAFCEE